MHLFKCDTYHHFLDYREKVKVQIGFLLFFLTFYFLPSNTFAETTIKVLLVNDVYTEIPNGESRKYLIKELPLEDYVKGVVAAEVYPDWEIEALKAQAVAARTYAVYHKKMNKDSLYHITSSVLHQVYKGSSFDTRVIAAVTETRSEILTFDNEPIEALYHSTAGERTENPEEVFGRSYPYLRSVELKCELSPYCAWQREIKLTDIEKALNLRGIKEIKIKSYTSTGRVKELDIVNGSTKVTISAKDFRKALGWRNLPSTNFSIRSDKDVIIFEGKGYGHGVGLCQWCAQEMAREGKNYREILSFFYPGTTIELYEGQ